LATVDILDAFDQVRSEVHLCPEDTVRQAIRNTLRDFCRVTRCYRYEVTGESIVPTISDYDVLIPNNEVMPITVEAMEVDESPCEFKPTEWLDSNLPGWRQAEGSNFSFFTHVTTPSVITFPCVPDAAATMNYRVLLQPKTDAENIDDSIVNEWKEVIETGAKARLLLMVNKPWTNGAAGDDLDKRYRAARGRAIIRINRSHGYTQDRWVGPRFA
jgi:hypothetical protein